VITGFREYGGMQIQAYLILSLATHCRPGIPLGFRI